MHTGTIYLLILLGILDLILLNADTYYSINTPASRVMDFTIEVKKHHLDLVSLRSNLGLILEPPKSEAMKGAKNLCRCTGRGLVK